MKIRNGFVSNSSSSSFIIINKTNVEMNLVDFVNENPHLIENWNNYYDYDNTQDELIESAIVNNIIFKPNSSDEYLFGDEDGTLIGRVFDYILRDGGESENFKWSFYDSYR